MSVRNKAAAAAIAAALAGGGLYLAAPTPPEPTGNLYVMRGLFGGKGAWFSYGVDVAADKAAKEYGLKTVVSSWRSSAAMCEMAIANYKKDRKPVYLLGHSLGGNEVADVSHCLNKAGVPVTFAFFYDPTPFVKCVPDNVKFATSWRRSFPFDLGGGYIKRCNGSGKDISNITVQTRHTTLDDLPSVHNATLRRIGVTLK